MSVNSTSSASTPNYEEACDAWRGAAQRTVDNAHMRYFVVHLHRLLDPDQENQDETPAAEAS